MTELPHTKTEAARYLRSIATFLSHMGVPSKRPEARPVRPPYPLNTVEPLPFPRGYKLLTEEQLQANARALAGQIQAKMNDQKTWDVYAVALRDFVADCIAYAEARPEDPQENPQASPAPIPMILFCLSCGLQHVDGPTVPVHRSHLCACCGSIWRPADVPTVGVFALQTRGEKDTARGFPLHARAADWPEPLDLMRDPIAQVLAETLAYLPPGAIVFRGEADVTAQTAIQLLREDHPSMVDFVRILYGVAVRTVRATFRRDLANVENENEKPST